MTTAISSPNWNQARIQRRTLVVLVISQVVGAVGVGIAPSIGVLLAEDVTASPTWAGLARTSSTLGAAIFGFLLGNIAARWGRRVALSLGWFIASVGAAALIYAAENSSAAVMFPGLLLIGAGSAVVLQARFAATDLAQPHHRARALSLVVWVGTLGSVLGPNLGIPGAVVSRATGLTVFASAFLIAAVFLAIGGLVVLIALRPDPLRVAHDLGTIKPARRRGGIKRLADELRANPRARLAVVAIVTAQIVMVSIMTMSPVEIAMDGGSVTIVGITISLHVAGMYALAPVVGILTDRFGHRLTIIGGIVILVASLVTAAVAPMSDGGMIASLILLGVGWSFINVAGSALFASVVADETRAAVQGSVDALANLCGAVAAFVAGPLMEATSFSMLAVLALAMLVPLTVVILINRARVGHPIA